MQKPAYPTALTNTDWQKKKGLLAKVKIQETGMGAKLTAIEKKYQETKWEWLPKDTADGPKGYGNPKQWKIDSENYKKAYNEYIVPLIEVVKAAEKHADNLRQELQSKASKDVLGALKSISEACEEFIIGLKNLSNLDKEFEKVRPESSEKKTDLSQVLGLPAMFENARKGIENWQQTGKMDNGGFQRFRSLGAVVAKTGEFAPVHNEWKVLTSLEPIKVGDDPLKVKEHAQKCINLIQRSTQLIPRN